MAFQKALPFVRFTIFQRGGVVLFNHEDYKNVKPRSDPVNSLIQNCLLQDLRGKSSFNHDNFTLKWSFENTLDIVFVVVYYSISNLTWIEDFFEAVKKAFCSEFDSLLKTEDWTANFKKFENEYQRLAREFNSRRSTIQKVPKNFSETRKGQALTDWGVDLKTPTKQKEEDGKKKTPGGKRDPKKFLIAKKTTPGSRRVKKKPKKSDGGSESAVKPKKEATQSRKLQKASKRNQAKIDRSKKSAKPVDDDEDYEIEEYEEDHEVNLEQSDSEEESDLEETEESGSGKLWGMFQRLTGTKELTEEDLTKALAGMKEHLVSKNVASEIAINIRDNVQEELIGQTCGTFNTVYRKVRDATRTALTRVLTPKRRINVLHEIGVARAEKRPYTIVFVGVNGVGKSTSLAKIGHYFKNRGLKTSIIACDTFRSGAIEQLKTHSQALRIRLFQRGYAKDNSQVCSDGIRQAHMEKDDVVLIDTAGRMQGKETLMRELAKLITVNRPDLVLFVGEALVGNDGVDQLVKFNQALMDHGSANNPRLIDGIVLTKFDTVDDKVGAAISMTYVSQKPILFVGVGQDYPDMKTLHVNTLLNKLFQ